MAYGGYHGNSGCGTEGGPEFPLPHPQQQYYSQGQGGHVGSTPPPYQCVPSGLRPLYGGTGPNPVAVNAATSWNKYGQT